MPKKRTTAAEKLQIMKRIIVDGKCSWNLKELEKAGGKAGVVTQAIKDVVQSLCDDNIIDQDKIGSGSFFWSFDSKNRLKFENKIKRLTEEKATLLEDQGKLEKKLEESKSTRKAEVRKFFKGHCCVMGRNFCMAHHHAFVVSSCMVAVQDRQAKLAEYQRLIGEKRKLDQEVQSGPEQFDAVCPPVLPSFTLMNARWHCRDVACGISREQPRKTAKECRSYSAHQGETLCSVGHNRNTIRSQHVCVGLDDRTVSIGGQTTFGVPRVL